VAGTYCLASHATSAVHSGGQAQSRVIDFQIRSSIKFIFVLALLCTFGLFLQTKGAHSQCAAQDVSGNRRLLDDFALSQPPEAVQSAAGTPVWKTIRVGTATNKWGLHRALDAANCGLGDAAEDMFAQPQFSVSATKIETDLVSVSLAQLGIASAPLQGVYARARSLGLVLAAAEVGPQLRLQYFEQPLGEFLNIGMAPIATRDGKLEIFVVGNGGAGLLLTGAKAGDAAKFQDLARFVFVRQRSVASSQDQGD
jgi:hypothetical protein